MSRATAVAAALFVVAGWAPPGARAQAQPRPSDQDIFGAPPADKPKDETKAKAKDETKDDAKPAPPASTPPEGAPPAAAPPADSATPPADAPEAARDSRDDSIMGAGAESGRSDEAAPEDPLKLGGMFYLRAQSTGQQGQDPDDWAMSAPLLLDAFMDARPNERVRGFILGRLLFDPTLPPAGTAPAAMPVGPSAAGAVETSSASGISDLDSLFAGRDRGPDVFLDQMWLRFDILHTVFVTAGKQHARWGTGRFWSPTDFLHIRRRNPLDVFDARTGTTMVKLHVPWEARGWNFYGYGLLEDAEAKPRVGDVGGAGRAEIVLGTTEIGAGALVQRGRKPKLAFDASTGIWELDLYGELALRYGSEIDRVGVDRDAVLPPVTMASQLPLVVEQRYPLVSNSGIKPQVVGGLSYARRYNDNDVWNLGAEYFYNALGYSSSEVYPGLVLPRARPLEEPATFFYLGRHYGAVFINVPAPYSWDYTSFTLSTLANFSDLSFISRLDYALTLLTHLRFEAFAALHYGDREGEFRFGVKEVNLGGIPFSLPPGLLDLGVALRVSI
jgi:hypothetical protein